MDETEFWELVDSTREAAERDPDDHAELLVERLVQLDPDPVLDFARHFEARYNRADTWDLRAAAAILLGTTADEVFDYFRCWLIGQGREVFEGAVHDPEVLAELLEDFDPSVDGDGEEIGFVADEAYEALTGVETPDLGLATPPPEPRGTPLDLDDDEALAERLPRLWDRFGG
ncbi:DUF4240 domain-containing protein [Streptomyces sp. NPDC095602]|uniref:DUF4240 domain-containing protein n=1 Tax=Streptomyces sp. NPDC095602 TaxID=3155819 RepID=UPI00331F49E7